MKILANEVPINIGPTVNPYMAFGAQGNQIVGVSAKGGVVRPRPDVMGVETYLTNLGRIASLTAKAVTLIYALYKARPVIGFVKALTLRGNAALPSGVVASGDCPTETKAVRLLADCDAEPMGKLADSGSTHPKLTGNIWERAAQDFVLVAQPILMFIERIGAVVSFGINKPSVLSLVPRGRATTPTSARWRVIGGGRQILNGLTPFAVSMRFDCGTNGYSCPSEPVKHSGGSNAEPPRYRGRTYPRPIGGGSNIEAHDFGNLFVAKFAVVLSLWHERNPFYGSVTHLNALANYERRCAWL